MATTSGTATSYHDLLDKLRLYLVAQGWTQKAWTAPGSITAQASLQMMGPGSGSGREVYVNIKTVADATAPYYSWRVRGATGYVSGAAEGLNPGELGANVYFNLWQNTIDYFFYVNDRRFIVVAKCSTAYMCLYAGLFLPFGAPAQYPYPMFIGGDYRLPVTWSTTDSSRRFFIDPGTSMNSGGDSNAWVRLPSGVWAGVANAINGAANDQSVSPTTGQVSMWPQKGDHNATSSDNLEAFGHGTGTGATIRALDNFVTTRQGERGLLPAMIIKQDEPTLGVLDGVFVPLGNGLATEQTMTVGSDTYKAFQNIQRASGNDFMFIKQA